MATKTKIAPSEFQIETGILDWLNMQRNCFAWKIETGGYFDQRRKIFRKRRSRHSIVGTSDIVGVIDGKLFALEVKSKTGRPSAAQVIFLERVKAAGGIGAVVRSIEEAATVLGIPVRSARP